MGGTYLPTKMGGTYLLKWGVPTSENGGYLPPRMGGTYLLSRGLPTKTGGTYLQIFRDPTYFRGAYLRKRGVPTYRYWGSLPTFWGITFFLTIPLVLVEKHRLISNGDRKRSSVTRCQPLRVIRQAQLRKAARVSSADRAHLVSAAR